MKATVFGIGLLMASVGAYGAEGSVIGNVGPDVHTNEVTYSVNGESYTGFLARDTKAEGNRPGILLVHEWWGQTEYVRQRAEELAALGYVAMAVDMYGGGKTAEHPDDAGAFSKAVMSDWSAAEANLRAATDILKTEGGVDPDRVAAIGYCFGGGVVLNAALDGMPFKAVVSFHGSPGQVVQTPTHFDGRVLIQNGLDDELVNQEDLAALLETYKSVDTDVTLIQYPGAKHAFTNPYVDAKAEKFGLPLAYSPAADAASWQVMLNLFNKVFSSSAGRPSS
ncbi:dienelactone hydrolase family protein [Larsenimonas salina]|uniref:dienelactone hydrolase family protein n=1 Tax=Larsenimonas salina TaxID=1295565 RepID=UPI0020733ACB|nr:dienelactone hydrolase family protein [Larsenimonas salina]MCM5704990.1 dienelactone hydrolase family protein [Larsenimonas salina]